MPLSSAEESEFEKVMSNLALSDRRLTAMLSESMPPTNWQKRAAALRPLAAGAVSAGLLVGIATGTLWIAVPFAMVAGVMLQTTMRLCSQNRRAAEQLRSERGARVDANLPSRKARIRGAVRRARRRLRLA